VAGPAKMWIRMLLGRSAMDFIADWKRARLSWSVWRRVLAPRVQNYQLLDNRRRRRCCWMWMPLLLCWMWIDVLPQSRETTISATRLRRRRRFARPGAVCCNRRLPLEIGISAAISSRRSVFY
jgi:hypothetical protein